MLHLRLIFKLNLLQSSAILKQEAIFATYNTDIYEIQF